MSDVDYVRRAIILGNFIIAPCQRLIRGVILGLRYKLVCKTIIVSEISMSIKAYVRSFLARPMAAPKSPTMHSDVVRISDYQIGAWKGKVGVNYAAVSIA